MLLRYQVHQVSKKETTRYLVINKKRKTRRKTTKINQKEKADTSSNKPKGRYRDTKRGAKGGKKRGKRRQKRDIKGRGVHSTLTAVRSLQQFVNKGRLG